jgi:hypothetical protein
MIRYILACIMLISTVSARLEVNVPGISVHFGQGADHAPRKLDDGGIFVFNPGIGVGYDFRDAGNTTGFSFIVSSMYFKDCSDRNMFIFGAGCRGRLMVTDNISLDINVLPSLGIIDDEKAFLPVVTAGMNYHFTPTLSTGLTFAFVPAFNDQASNLGFFVLNLAF